MESQKIEWIKLGKRVISPNKQLGKINEKH